MRQRVGYFLFFILSPLFLFIVYKSSLGLGFIFDDLATIVFNKSLQEGSLSDVFWFNPFRALVYVSFYFQANELLKQGGEPYLLSAFWFRVFNILIHFLNGCLLFFLGMKFSNNRKVALLFGLLLFWFHPIFAEPLNFISARFDLMATFFCLVALNSYFSIRKSWLKLALFFLNFFMALISKESSVVLPFIVFFLTRALADKQNRLFKLYKLNRYELIMFATALLYIVLRSNWLIVRAKYPERLLSPLKYFLVENWLIWLYNFKLFFPIHLNFDYHIEPKTYLGGIFLLFNFVICIALIYGFLKKASLFSALCLCYFLCYAPTSSFLPLEDLFRETRAYFPTTMMFLTFLTLSPPDKSLKNNKLALSLAIFILACFVSLTVERNRAFSSPVKLWQDTVRKSPLKHRPVYNLANSLRRELELERALRYYRLAHKLDPSHKNTLWNIELVEKAIKSGEVEHWKEELKEMKEKR